MSTARSSSRPNQKNLTEHPHYFGAFLNIARHNAYMVMVHLSAKYKVIHKGELTEDSISTAKLFTLLGKKYNKPDVTSALIRDLKRYFPWLNYPLFLNLQTQQAEDEEDADVSFETDPEKLRELLQNSFILLNDLRNNFSHYITANDYARIDFSPFSKVYQAAIFRLTDRSKHTKRFDVFEAEHVGHLQNQGGNASVYSPRPLSATELHENTIAFITCLFLERKYAFPFLSRLASFQYTPGQVPSLSEKATMECYTMFCCRLPQPKLESSDILLDMANELGRCPSALYTVLSEEDRSQFHVMREVVPYLEHEEEDPDEGLEQEVVLKRHGDRFPYFALRYFDDTQAFPSLRFNIDLGKWRSKPVYEKVIYGESRDRLLTKPLLIYARLTDVTPLHEAVSYESRLEEKSGEIEVHVLKRVDEKYTDLFPKNWIVKGTDGGQYLDDRIERFAPKYNFGENVIAIKFIKDPKMAVKNLISRTQGSRNEQADAIISTHELRSLFLYDYLHKMPVADGSSEAIISQDTEAFIKDYIDRIKRFFRDVKQGDFPPLVSPPDYRKNEQPRYVRGDRAATQKNREEYAAKQEKMSSRKEELREILAQRYGLLLHQIPSRLKEYLLAYQTPSYRVRAKQKFQQQADEVKERLKDVDRGRSPRVGEQATWLAEDIVFLTPPQIHEVNGEPHPQKLNNDQFRVLQSSLAYFSVENGKIIHFLENETHILAPDTAQAHPFLGRINLEACTGILDFYIAYLEEKERWLRNIFRKLKRMSNQKVKNAYEAYLPSTVELKDATELDYSKLPVYLPRGVFDRPIAAALAEHTELEVKANDSAAYCLAQLFAEDSQAFYELKHLYRSVFTSDGDADEWMESTEYYALLTERREEVQQKKKARGLSREEKQDLKNEYKDLTRAKKRLLNREQYLRSIQADDRALWLMLRQRQARRSEHLEISFDQLKLRQIESILREPVQVSLLIPDTSVKITDELPLRRYGDLRRVAKDRRLANLARYYAAAGQDEIAHEVIKQELERYDRRREAFFETIYRFERTVFQKYEMDFPAMNDKGFYNHRVYAEMAVKHSADHPFNLFFREQVPELRNKFHHNEFPWFEWLLPEVQAQEEVLFADRVFEVAEAHYRRMLGLI